MPRVTRGSTYTTRKGIGIRWPENGQRRHQDGFRNKTEAQRWFDQHVAPRLDDRAHGPSPDITLDEFCGVFMARWKPGKAARTVATMEIRLASARARFGDWTLRELEQAVDEVEAWRAVQPTEHARYRHTRALRQVLNAAVRWRYIDRNPAADFGANCQPRAREVDPFTVTEIDAIAAEIGPRYGPLVIFAAETGLRTNEWVALERRDLDRRRQLVIIRHRVTGGEEYPDPKTDRHSVPLTPRAEAALDAAPRRMDTPLVFPASKGGHIDLDNWRLREWYPALEAAGVSKRGPYALRHTFATEALAAGASTFDLSEMMGSSLEMIERHYGHLAAGRLDHLRELLARRSGVVVAMSDADGSGNET